MTVYLLWERRSVFSRIDPRPEVMWALAAIPISMSWLVAERLWNYGGSAACGDRGSGGAVARRARASLVHANLGSAAIPVFSGAVRGVSDPLVFSASLRDLRSLVSISSAFLTIRIILLSKRRLELSLSPRRAPACGFLIAGRRFRCFLCAAELHEFGATLGVHRRINRRSNRGQRFSSVGNSCARANSRQCRGLPRPTTSSTVGCFFSAVMLLLIAVGQMFRDDPAEVDNRVPVTQVASIGWAGWSALAVVALLLNWTGSGRGYRYAINGAFAWPW